MTDYIIPANPTRPPPSTPALPVAVVKKIDAIVANEVRGINLRCAVSQLMLRADDSELNAIAERLELKAKDTTTDLRAGGYLHYARLARRAIRQRQQSVA